MLDTNDLLTSIKKAAVEAVEAKKPTQLTFGTVVNVAPLTIMVEQKMPLTTAQLILTRNVTNYTVNVAVNWIAEDVSHTHKYTDDAAEMTTQDTIHNHQIKGIKQITIYNNLLVGDEVILLRMQGGQKYIVLDKVVKL